MSHPNFIVGVIDDQTTEIQSIERAVDALNKENLPFTVAAVTERQSIETLWDRLKKRCEEDPEDNHIGAVVVDRIKESPSGNKDFDWGMRNLVTVTDKLRTENPAVPVWRIYYSDTHDNGEITGGRNLATGKLENESKSGTRHAVATTVSIPSQSVSDQVVFKTSSSGKDGEPDENLTKALRNWLQLSYSKLVKVRRVAGLKKDVKQLDQWYTPQGGMKSESLKLNIGGKVYTSDDLQRESPDSAVWDSFDRILLEGIRV